MDAVLDARIFAECWKPFGKAQQICSEGIEITSPAERACRSGQVSGAATGAGSSGGAVVPGNGALEPGRFEPCFRWPIKSFSIPRMSPMRIARCSICGGCARRAARGRSALDSAYGLARGDGASVRRRRSGPPSQVTAAKISLGDLGSPPARDISRLGFARLCLRRGVTIECMLEPDAPGLRSVKLATVAGESYRSPAAAIIVVEVSGAGRHYRSMLPSDFGRSADAAKN